jgi:hypothetical protein
MRWCAYPLWIRAATGTGISPWYGLRRVAYSIGTDSRIDARPAVESNA